MTKHRCYQAVHEAIDGRGAFAAIRAARLAVGGLLAALWLGLPGCMALPDRAAAPGADAYTYFVAPTGSDDNPGTAARPFRTIQHAADVARAGDRVLVRAGVYREGISFPRSGTAEAPIVFEGERSDDGDWLTTVDRSVPVTGWTEAPEIGAGVFKTEALDFHPGCMTLNGRMLARVRDDYMGTPRARLLLTMPADERVRGSERLRDSVPQMDYGGHIAEEHTFWDGIEALYGTADGVTYIRFRDGADPREMALMAAPDGGGFSIENQRHIVVRSFRVRGAAIAVDIRGPDAAHNLIEQNRLKHGRARVFISEHASHNIIRGNEMTMAFHGNEHPGSWASARGREMEASLAVYLYRTFKYMVGYGTSDDVGVHIETGDANEVLHNHIHDGLLGIRYRQTRDLRIARNIIRNMSSVGLITEPLHGHASVNAHIHDNLITNCNSNIRMHGYHTVLPGQRSEYYYRNIIHQPRWGFAVFFHWGVGERLLDGRGHSTIAFYHNLFSGGLMRHSNPALHMEKTILVNNIFHQVRMGEVVFQAFDYNHLAGVGALPDDAARLGFGPNNTLGEALEGWDDDDPAAYRLPPDHPARGTGIDLSRPFVLNGIEFEPLPGMDPDDFSGTAPDPGP